MLDDLKVIAQRDTHDALQIAAQQWQQVQYDTDIQQGDHDGRRIDRIVIAGMGGSALAALMLKNWLEPELSLPIEVVRTYTLPAYVGANTLVICSSYSGNTEETVACLGDARARGAQIAVIASGGRLQQAARAHDIAYLPLPVGLQPRMAVLYNLRALVKLLVHFDLLDERYYSQLASYADWLRQETQQWVKEVSIDKNPAKQLALFSVGKTSVFYAGHVMFPVAYKWKISWNETAKNVAFCNELPEFNHNEFMGWASHPVQKPYAVFDLMSEHEHPQVTKRFVLSDRLLSGRRPKSHTVQLQGDSVIAQMMWGCILADFASIYTAVLNGVDPTPVPLIERLKTLL